MGFIHPHSGTKIEEIAEGIHRISTPIPPEIIPDGFTYNQFLIDDEQPLLYHTGLRRMFPLVRDAVAAVVPLERLRWISFSHWEADECGSLNEFLEAAPNAEPLCGELMRDLSADDVADRAARGMADGEELKLGQHTVRWLATPHVPHGWECGHLFETTTRTLFCGDLFTQKGHEQPAITKDDLLEPSEAMRERFDYYAHSRDTGALLEKLARTEPALLACMHGSSWRGDGADLLRRLAARLDQHDSGRGAF
ncbi:MAG: MBL fold metallo-hydrolase [Planctomycetota bacterium]|nr:MBL fold metallo-hydrolase [Planctomycetota bacterium]